MSDKKTKKNNSKSVKKVNKPTKEKWKRIRNYPNYEASSRGRIKSIKTNTIIKLGLQRGRLFVTLWKDNKKKNFLVHRIIAEVFIKKPEGLDVVHHINGIMTDNDVSNLEWSTQDKVNKIRDEKFIKKKDVSPNDVIVAEEKTLKRRNKSKSLRKPKSAKRKAEKWMKHPIKEFKGIYEISSHGRIRRISTGTILKEIKRNGYRSHRYANGDFKKSYKTHRLVAMLYVPNKNPKKYKDINHIDGNKLNNYYKNLEWTNCSGNTSHAIETGLQKLYMRRVNIYDLNGNHIGTCESVKMASEITGVDHRNISNVCAGRRKRSGGYRFEYADDDPNKQEIDLAEYKQLKKFPNYYINKEGKLYSKTQKKFRRTSIDANRCHTVYLSKKKDGKNYGASRYIHNIVAQYFLKKPKDREVNCVRHKDGDKSNNHVDNLRWTYVPGVKLAKV
jgi:hypothetical protein